MRIRTNTVTSAFSRPNALWRQIQWATVRLHPRGTQLFEKVIRPALDRQAYRALRFLGIDHDGLPFVEFRLPIDWDEHARRLAMETNFDVPDGWLDNVSAELRLGVKTFEEEIDDKGLDVHAYLQVRRGDDFDGMAGLRKVTPPRLPGGQIILDTDVRHLTELRMYLACKITSAKY